MIDNQVFLTFAVPVTVLVLAIACRNPRHHTIAPSAAIALMVTGVAWPATTAFQADDPALLLAPVFGLVVAGLSGGFLHGALIMGAGRWPLSLGDLLRLPAIGACLGPLTGGLGIAVGLLIGAMSDLWGQRTCKGEEGRRRVPPVACAAAAALAVSAFMPPYAQGQEIPAVDEPGVVSQGESLAAVVLGPEVDTGPPGADEHMTSLAAAEPLTLAEAAARLAALTLLAVEVEERPSRTGITHPLDAPEPRRFDLEGSLVEVLDRLAALYAHRWEWRDTALVFYRYWDEEFALATQSAPETRQARWAIDTDRDATLAEVLERWSHEAGWTLVWSASTDYRLGADAVFEGSFLGAVDALLADPATHATLAATAHPTNRRLVIEEVR